MGPGFWHKKAYKRVTLAGGKETNVTEFLQAQMNEGAFHDLVVEPFSQKVNPHANPTRDERQNLNRLMDASGSVAARRAHRELNKATNVVGAAAKLKVKAQQARDRHAALHNRGAFDRSQPKDKKIRPSKEGSPAERQGRREQERQVDHSLRGGLRRAQTQKGIGQKRPTKRGTQLKRATTQQGLGRR